MRLKPKDAAIVAGVSPRTLHRWCREGKISRTDAGFEMAEVFKVADERNPAALLIRAGVPKDQWPEWVGDAPSRKRVA